MSLEGEIPDIERIDIGIDPLQRLRSGSTIGSRTVARVSKASISRVDRGSFTVVTGKIGSGKSTLVRALLGLVPPTATCCGTASQSRTGRRSSYRRVPPTPPRYRGSSPNPSPTTSHSGRGWRGSVCVRAVQLAVLDPDLERLEMGEQTLVGARGVKLSGGQVQRSAAARMHGHRCRPFVFDDLSSALDVHTETELWRRLLTQRDVTCLVVSHRRAALSRADQILLMDGGRVVDRGALPGSPGPIGADALSLGGRGRSGLAGVSPHREAGDAGHEGEQRTGQRVVTWVEILLEVVM